MAFVRRDNRYEPVATNKQQRGLPLRGGMSRVERQMVRLVNLALKDRAPNDAERAEDRTVANRS